MMAIFSCTLVAMGQKKLIVCNAENGDSMTVTIPNGMTIEVEEPTIGKSLLAKAIQYENEGRIFEASNALYQAWIMGEKEEVDRHLHEDEAASGVLTFIRFANSEMADSCLYLELKEVKGREAEDLCLMYEAYNDRNSITDEMVQKLTDSPIINYMTSRLHQSVMGDSLTRDQIRQNLQKSLDDGFLFAYGKMGAMAFEDGKCQEAMKLYEQAFEAGCLDKDDIAFIRQIADHSNDITISPEIKLSIDRMDFISYKYWKKLMER